VSMFLPRCMNRLAQVSGSSLAPNLLVVLRTPFATAERLLHGRAVHPAMAHEAVAWAVAHGGVTQRLTAGDRPPTAA
jgi:hypothetical protein